jgi:hypothetical protein
MRENINSDKPHTTRRLFGLLKDLGRVHVGAHAELARRLNANGQLVAGNHLDANTHLDALLNRRLCVVARRVKDGNEADKLPVIARVTLGKADAQGAVPASGVLENLALKARLNLLVVRGHLEDNLQQLHLRP